MHQTNLPRTSVYHPSDSTGGNFFPDRNFPIDQPIDLNLELPEDVSISDLSNRGFELPEDGGMMKNGVGGDM